MVKRSLGVVVCGVAVACSVSAVPASTGGIDAGMSGAGDAARDGQGGASLCPSALVVADSDFMSTNISVLSPVGAVLSGAIISSASAPPGLTTALSGDVVLPLAPTPGELVLIDRASAVLTWVNPSTAAVKHQLPVGTGFSANPHDYVELSPTKAYVTRYDSNPSAGKQANDGGGDVLIVDPQAPSITGRVPFTPDGAFLPRADRMIRVGGEVWVSLQRFDANFTSAGDARLVGISTASDSIAWTLDLTGVASCGGIAMSPSGKVVALACSGASSDANPTQRSAIVLLDATAHPPVEIKRIAAATQLGGPLDSTLAYASDSLLVGVVIGDSQAKRNDTAYSVAVASGAAQVIADAGMPFMFGDVRCAPGCSDLCFLADANAKTLRTWKANGAALTAQPPGPVDPTVGLPPRYLGSM